MKGECRRGMPIRPTVIFQMPGICPGETNRSCGTGSKRVRPSVSRRNCPRSPNNLAVGDISLFGPGEANRTDVAVFDSLVGGNRARANALRIDEAMGGDSVIASCAVVTRSEPSAVIDAVRVPE